MAKDKKANNAPPLKMDKKTKSEGSSHGSSGRLRIAKAKPKPSHFNPAKEGADFRHIVRVANRDIPGYMSIAEGLTLIYGISHRLGTAIEGIFFKDTGKEIHRIGNINDKEIETLEKIIQTIDKRVPAWLLNRPKQFNGDKAQYIMADLKLVERKELQRLGKTKSYRGLRLQWGQRVRGQKSKSTGRRHTTIGVEKKK